MPTTSAVVGRQHRAILEIPGNVERAIEASLEVRLHRGGCRR